MEGGALELVFPELSAVRLCEQRTAHAPAVACVARLESRAWGMPRRLASWSVEATFWASGDPRCGGSYLRIERRPLELRS